MDATNRPQQFDLSQDVLDIIKNLSSHNIAIRMQEVQATYKSLRSLYRAAVARERNLPSVEGHGAK
jgi:hypothetical protein